MQDIEHTPHGGKAPGYVGSALLPLTEGEPLPRSPAHIGLG